MGTSKVINLDLGDRSYDIFIKGGILDSVGTGLKEIITPGRCAVVTNPTVGPLYAGRLKESLKGAGFDPLIIEVPDGEEYKNLEEIGKILDVLVENKLERTSPIIALGGGVIGDMTGFVAASYLRGVPYIQVPTTLLSQVDSSVGGKTGVNHRLGKNLIGAFYQPKGVFIDPEVLSTLDERELRSGMAEVVKYGVIWDEAFFTLLEESSTSLYSLDDLIVDVIERSCTIKSEVVKEDERESGIRAILNFGHTIGHAIESLTGYRNITHGEGVSIGMVMAADLSHRLGRCSCEDAERVRGLVDSLGLMSTPPPFSTDEMIKAIKGDKKVISGEIRFVLMNSIGDVVIEAVEEGDIRALLDGVNK